MDEFVNLKRKQRAESVETGSLLKLYLEGDIELQEYLEGLDETAAKFDKWKTMFGSRQEDSALFMVDMFDEDDCKYMFSLLEKLPLDVKPQFKMFSKVCTMHRDVGFFAGAGVSGYTYARQTSKAKPITNELVALMKLINHICGATFNGILINKYEPDGSIDAHSDNETGLSRDVGVVALSFGATRTMRFRKIATKEQKAEAKTRGEKPTIHDVVMNDGSAMCMFGEKFQRIYTHEISALKKDAFRTRRIRYSLTFRCHKIEK
jgi:alkylated DNA repair dioxygenase AlkB